MEPIRDRVAFYDERVDLEVDGETWERPETQWSRRGSELLSKCMRRESASGWAWPGASKRRRNRPNRRTHALACRRYAWARAAATRRGLLQAGGAGAAALGAAACGDDYFEPATDHDQDAPNVLLLIFTDSTRADFIGAYNRDRWRNNTPNLDALAQGLAPLRPRRARGHAHGPRPPGPPHRRPLLPLP